MEEQPEGHYQVVSLNMQQKKSARPESDLLEAIKILDVRQGARDSFKDKSGKVEPPKSTEIVKRTSVRAAKRDAEDE